MPFFTFCTYLLVLSCANLRVYAANRGITLAERVDAVEYALVEQALLFTIPLTPCSTFVDEIDSSPGAIVLNAGEQTSAGWIRLIFHDFITADVAAGTGGVDASIGFESERAENIGKHFINDSLIFFNQFVNAYVSLADAIAMGTIMTVTACSGLDAGIEMKAGRIDATEGGPTGVPEAFTDLNTTLATFKKAGFNQTEAILAVACGHSLGSVHHVNFPDIVDKDSVTENNTDGASTFDSSPDVFDNTVITEYLTGAGKGGGPLVTGSNVTTRSDLRLFESDNNATMESLSSPDAFHRQCGYIFQRMIDSVPAAVTLSEPVSPRKWKLMTYNFELAANGTLSLSGKIRYFCGVGRTCPAPPTLSYTFDALHGSSGPFSTLPLPSMAAAASGSCISSFSTTAPFVGNFSAYCFSNTITSSTTAINIQNEYSHSLFPSIFVAKSNSSITLITSTTNETETTLNSTLTLSGAALTRIVGRAETLDVVVYQKGGDPVCQQVIFDMKCTRITERLGTLKRQGTAGEYTVFTGNMSWIGETPLQAIQVGFRNVWSMSTDKRGIKIITTNV